MTLPSMIGGTAVTADSRDERGWFAAVTAGGAGVGALEQRSSWARQMASEGSGGGGRDVEILGAGRGQRRRYRVEAPVEGGGVDGSIRQKGPPRFWVLGYLLLEFIASFRPLFLHADL